MINTDDSNQPFSKRVGKAFIPPQAIPDTLNVPENTIFLVPDSAGFESPPHFEKLGSNRDWFTSYFYMCLPLVFGNQHGFVIKATYDFVVRWDGRPDLDAVLIHNLEPVGSPNYIVLESHFGSGILTIQSRYTYRTPPGVNLMVKEPPNYPIDGFSWMNAVVETDNLRRDFTFNIKITRPHVDIYIRKGTPLGCILPYPRYFLDPYVLKELTDPEELAKAQTAINDFAIERSDFDSGKPRLRYMEGKDIYGNLFKEHQKTLDFGNWWHNLHGQTGEPRKIAKCPIPSMNRPAMNHPENNPTNSPDGKHKQEQLPWWKRIFSR